MRDVILMFSPGDFRLSSEHTQSVASAASGFDVALGDDGVSEELYARTVIFYGGPSAEQLQRMPWLKWVQLPFAGADKYADKAFYGGRDIIVTQSSGVFGLPIAEHALGVMLMLSRNMHIYRDQQHSRLWKGYMPTTDFCGSYVLIVGMGDIGVNVASRAKALGAYVACVKRTSGPKPEFVDELHGINSLDSLLPLADFLVLCVPGTVQTRGMIDSRRLAMMKRNAVLVNVGRGSAIVTADLISALNDGVIKACGLDVTDTEPLPADSPLWGMSNVFITPHNSGRSPTNDARSLAVFIDNLDAYINKKPMRNIVNFSKGY